MPVQVQELSSRITSAVEELWQGMGTLVERIFAKKEKETQTASVVVAVADTNQQLQTGSSTTTSTSPNSLEQASRSQATVINNYITQPIIERIIENSAQGGVSETTLTTRLQDLASQLNQRIQNAFLGAARSAIVQNVSDITVNGVSGLTDADIPDGITASNYLALTGGALTGSLTGTNLTLSGDLTVSGAQTLSGDITIPYLSATSTTASTFIQASTTRFS